MYVLSEKQKGIVLFLEISVSDRKFNYVYLFFFLPRVDSLDLTY